MSRETLKDGESVYFDRDGNVVKRQFARDGDRVRIGMMMLDRAFPNGAPAAPVFDAAGQRPREMRMSDVDTARRLGSRQAYINRLNDGWKQPQSETPVIAAPSPSPAPAPQPTVTVDRSVADAAYQRRNLRLESAWKESL